MKRNECIGQSRNERQIDNGGGVMLEDNENQRSIHDCEPDRGPKITCPVCGNPLGALNLPCKESVVEESLYSDGNILIVNSDIVIKCEFDHCRNEEDGTSLDDPHLLVSVIDMTFDSQGECTHFAIKEIHPSKVCNR